jgi:isopenicillin N synthase-like dioxygenase
MSLNRIKRLNLKNYVCGNSSERQQFSRELLAALKEFGFFILVNHDLDNRLIARSLKVTGQFFSLPASVKESYHIAEAMGQRGYTGFGTRQAIKNNAPDPKEYWHMGRDTFLRRETIAADMRNVYPKEVSEFRPVLRDLFNKADEIGRILLEALGEGLGAPPNYFKELTEDGNCVMRCLHYPATANLVGSETSVYRAAPHKDINFFTLLIGETNTGLQFECNDGSWLDVKAESGEIIIDSGEMLSLITNNEIKATTHQVIRANDERSSRYSIVFLVHPYPEAELVCLDSYQNDGETYTPITAHNYLMERIAYWQRDKEQ